MEDSARARAEKLKALREKAAAKAGGEGGEDGAKPVIRFRNYQPKTEELKEAVLPAAVAPKGGDVVAKQDEDVRLDVAPKKPNWDLKRDIAKKLEKLERRTQQAIAEIIREQVMKSEESGDVDKEAAGKILAQAVSTR